MDLKIILQGIDMPRPTMAGDGAPEPRQKPTTLQSSSGEPFQFHNPPDTAGMAKVNTHRKPPRPILPTATATIQPLVRYPLILSPPSTTIPHLAVSTVHYSTEQYRKRKEEKVQEGIVKRKYTKSSSIVKCPKCGQERKPPTHQQYMGYRYCMHADVVTFDTWRADLQAKGVARKSKQP